MLPMRLSREFHCDVSISISSFTPQLWNSEFYILPHPQPHTAQVSQSQKCEERKQICHTFMATFLTKSPPCCAGVHKNVTCLRDFFSSDQLSKKVRDIKFWKYNSLVLAFHDEQSVQVIWSHSYINFKKEKKTEY